MKKEEKINQLAKIILTLNCASDSMKLLKDTNEYIVNEIIKENQKKIHLLMKEMNLKTITLNPTGHREITFTI